MKKVRVDDRKTVWMWIRKAQKNQRRGLIEYDDIVEMSEKVSEVLGSPEIDGENIRITINPNHYEGLLLVTYFVLDLTGTYVLDIYRKTNDGKRFTVEKVEEMNDIKEKLENIRDIDFEMFKKFENGGIKK